MTMIDSRSRFTRLVLAELNFRSGDARSPGALKLQPLLPVCPIPSIFIN